VPIIHSHDFHQAGARLIQFTRREGATIHVFKKTYQACKTRTGRGADGRNRHFTEGHAYRSGWCCSYNRDGSRCRSVQNTFAGGGVLRVSFRGASSLGCRRSYLSCWCPLLRRINIGLSSPRRRLSLSRPDVRTGPVFPLCVVPHDSYPDRVHCHARIPYRRLCF
jgi:hypothetical protein